MLAALASSPATKALDPDPFPRHSLRHAVYAALLHFGFETATFKANGPRVEIPKAKAADLHRKVKELTGRIHIDRNQYLSGSPR